MATATAAAVADTRPVAVNTSAVMPILCSLAPTGPVARSTVARQRPSNIRVSSERLATGYHPCHPAPRFCGTPGQSRNGRMGAMTMAGSFRQSTPGTST